MVLLVFGIWERASVYLLKLSPFYSHIYLLSRCSLLNIVIYFIVTCLENNRLNKQQQHQL